MPLQVEMYDDKKKKSQSFEVRVIGVDEDYFASDYFLGVMGRDHDDALETLDEALAKAIATIEATLNELKLMQGNLGAHVVPKYPGEEIDKRPYNEIVRDW